MLQVCPTVIVHASAVRVWNLLTIPEELTQWSDGRIIEAPRRTLEVGDRLVLGVGVGHRMKVVLDVQEATPPRRLALRIRLPFAIVNNEVIEILPLDGPFCRVTFN
jgi:uncharacterized protein YndB with AHSA1/START domain